MNGYGDGLLRVNLTTRIISLQPINPEEARELLGCKGLGTKILLDELPTSASPLGEENILILMTGPLVNSNFPGTSRYTVMAKSPLTGLLGEATAGGFFGKELKKSGYDGLIIEGRSETPVYLWIDNGQVEIRDADHLWGKNTDEVEDSIRDETGCQEARVASIGIGGENLVPYACIINDKSRAAGRTGMGAVMGSKKLKAIAVHGNKKLEVNNQQRLDSLRKEFVTLLMNSPYAKSRKAIGSAEGILANNALGCLPTYNFKLGTFENADNISGETLMETIFKKNWSCANCPVGSGKVVEVKDGPFGPISDRFKGPEYESLAGFGSMCGNGNLEAIAKANELCFKYAIDTISTSNSIAFAMECFQSKVISREDIGFDLTWGDPTLILELIEMIARRQGFGKLLSEGVKKMSERFGKGSEKYAMHVKGLEFAFHDPRTKTGLAITYATANRGACHMAMIHDTFFKVENRLPEIGLVLKVDPYITKGKASFVKTSQDFSAVIDILPLCKWIAPPRNLITVTHLLSLIETITGFDYSAEELIKVGERAINLGRLFNCNHGLTLSDEQLPERLFEPLGEHQIDRVEFYEELQQFYRERGWDTETGRPTDAKTMELGI